MTIKQYKTVKLIFVIIVAIIFSQAVIFRFFLLPIAALIASSLILLYLRRKVTTIIADERDYKNAGKASLLAMQIFAWIGVIIMVTVFALQDSNPIYLVIGNTLAFSICGLILLYAILFRYYNHAK